VEPTRKPAQMLAQRLKALREQQWPGAKIRQGEFAAAIKASPALISSWENAKRPVTPPPDRIAAYATFFATRRSIERRPFRLFGDQELTDDEHAIRKELEEELLDLRQAAVKEQLAPSDKALSKLDTFLEGTPWHFSDGMTVTLICSQLPSNYHGRLAEPANPDYNELYTFSDLDALFELHGHIRAVNPHSDVVYRTPANVQPDDFTTHLVVIGGVDWNSLTNDATRWLDIPVTQESWDVEPQDAAFSVENGTDRQVFRPVVKEVKEGGDSILVEDVGHFVRGPNPYDRLRTITICNGMYSRGVYGAVRALTDARLRDRNAEFIAERFAKSDTYSVLFRVKVAKRGLVLTPDWTKRDTVLHQWVRPNSA
jgi:transcriptional regulator with XRE-family HTH domain